MFVTRKSLSRRSFLQGTGVVVALPFLEAMVPALTAFAKTPASPRLRFGAVYFPNGVVVDQWTPATGGTSFELSATLQPLAAFRDRLTVIGNLQRPGADTATDHAVSSAGWLSGVTAKRTEAEDVHLGPTIDQIIASAVGHETRYPSLELATEDFTGYVGGCVPGYSCTYMNTISWSGPTTPLPMQINPRVVFERLFGRAGTHEERIAGVREDRSILDGVAEDAGDLLRQLGASDRTRVNQYLENVREVERRVQRAEQQTEASLVTMDAPLGIPESFEEHVALMFELLAVAYEADITRVGTFMMAREASQRTYPQIGLDEPHHAISHHANVPGQIVKAAKINAYHVSLFAKFLERLSTTPDGDGSLLDHSLIFYGGGMGNGNSHSPSPLPLTVFGKGLANIQGGRNVVPGELTPIANLWLGMAEKFGCELESFGESTGRLLL